MLDLAGGAGQVDEVKSRPGFISTQMQSVKSLWNLTCVLADRRGRDGEKLVWVFFKKEKRGALKMICEEGVGMNLVPAGGAQRRRAQ